jgi:uncharacterized OB-fold protein
MGISGSDNNAAGVDLGARSVAGGDEDSNTMAVAAVRALDCATDEQPFVYLASSTHPIAEMTNASIVAAAGHLASGTCPVDLSGVRSGVAGLLAASASGGIAVASDVRTGSPGSSAEVEGGDAAVAFHFAATDDPVAVIETAVTHAVPVADFWREPGGSAIQTWEERFLADLYISAATSAIGELLDAAGTQPTITVVSCPLPRVAQAIGTRFAGTGDRPVQATHRRQVGYCGTADAAMLLAGALDACAAGDTVLVVSIMGGVDAVLVRALRDGRDRSTRAGEQCVEVPYLRYLAWRGQLTLDPGRRPNRQTTSQPAAFRSNGWKYSLTGSRCDRCGFVHLPAERVCAGCGALNSASPYSVADRLATVVSLSSDAVGDGGLGVRLAGVVDFDDGGRMSVEFTDADGCDLGPGSRVAMVFRRTSTIGGLPNYFWRARPLRREEP